MAYTGPRLIHDAQVKLALVTPGAFTEYGCQVKTARLVPTAGDRKDYRTLCSTGLYSQFTPTLWDLELEGAQDYGTDGLARFLFENDGALVRFQVDGYGETHVPSDEEPGMTGTCRAVAVEYGGAVDEYAEFTVTMPVQGEPTLAVAAFPASLEAGDAQAATGQAAPGASPMESQVAA